MAPVIIRGTRYRSGKAAARALGVAPSTISTAIRRGKLDTVGLGRGCSSQRPVKVGGILYPSCLDAARALGVTAGQMSNFLAVRRAIKARAGA